jgi:hypothetical protein
MVKRPLSVRLEKPIHDALEEFVADSGSTVTQVVEAAIKAYLGLEEEHGASLADRVAALESWRDSLGKLKRVA